MDNSVPFDTVPWQGFLPRFHWRQGEHIVVVKPTGGGKTTLIGELLRTKAPVNGRNGERNIVIFVTKARDKTFRKQFPHPEWFRCEQWPPPRHKSKILLWPEYRQGMTIPQYTAIRRAVFSHALDCIFGEGGWTIVIDEEHVLCQTLGQSERITEFVQQGRSSGLTVVNGIQRPAWVPVATYPNATHAFIGNISEPEDMKRLSNLGGGLSGQIKKEAQGLDFFEFMYIPARAKKGKVPLKTTVDLSTPTSLKVVS